VLATIFLSPLHRVELAPFYPLPARPVDYKDEMAKAKLHFASGHRGFESLTFDEKGRLFASHPDAIYLLDVANDKAVEYVYTGYYPAFVIADGKGSLLVGDFMQGLLEIDIATKDIKCLLKKVDGLPLKFTETIALAQNGEDLYLTDGSQQGIHFDNAQKPKAIFSSILAGLQAHYDGRLIHYNRRTKVAKTLVTGFIFANGIALDKNEESVFVADTFTSNVTRVWVKGPKAGKIEVVLDRLPCTPDNMARGDKLGGFLLACPNPRSAILDNAQPYPLAKKILSWIPIPLIPVPPPFAACVHFDDDGKLIHIYSDSKGVAVHGTTTCLERDGTIYFSGIEMEGIATLKIQ
jgi:sugar lactone lactonase YvrE